MRRWIDKTVLITLLTGTSFALFLYAWRSFYPALMMSGAVLIALLTLLPPLFRAIEGRRDRRLLLDGRALGMLHGLVYAPYDEAFALAKRAVLTAYGYDGETALDGRGVHFAFFQRHEDGFPVDASEIAQIYRENRSAEKIIVLSPGMFDEKARRAADQLVGPKFLLFDGPRLRECLKALPEDASTPEDSEKKRRRTPRIHLTHKLVRRSLLYAALLMALYFVLGINTYLIASMLLLTLALIGRRRSVAPEKLI